MDNTIHHDEPIRAEALFALGEIITAHRSILGILHEGDAPERLRQTRRALEEIGFGLDAWQEAPETMRAAYYVLTEIQTALQLAYDLETNSGLDRVRAEIELVSATINSLRSN